MGYYMNQLDSVFKIKPENFDKAKQAILDLMTKTNQGGGYSNGERSFSWVTTSTVLNAKSLETMLSEWGWDVEFGHGETNEHIVDISFNGEKSGDEIYLWIAIAPFVEDCSYIEMMGEDQYHWRWTFDNGKMIEKTAVVTWE
jgi:hypothetical protein